MKIKNYLVLFAAAVLIPVVIFSGYILKQLLDEEREAMFQSMHELARASVLAVDQELTYALATAKTLSTSALLAKGDFEAFYYQAVAANKGRAIHTALIDENGQQVFNTMGPFGEKISAPSPENKERVRDVVQKNAPQISNLIVGSRSGKYVIAVEVPVQLEDGRRFVVTEWMYASQLNDVLPQKGVPGNWLIALYDRNGTIAGRSSKPEVYVGTLPVPELHKLVLSRDQNQFQLPSKEGWGAYGVIDWSKFSGWSAAVGVPVNEFEAAAHNAVALAALGLLAAIACAVAAAWVFSRRLVRSIDGAKQSAVLLGQSKVPEVVASEVQEVNELHVALQEAGEKLEATEKARTAHLKEAEQARAEAEAQNKAKDEFLAMLGHELRNPLAAITGGVTLLGLGGASAQVSQRAQEVIARQSRHLTSLVDELLDTHRVMSGKVSLSMQRVRLDTAVQSSLDALHARGTASHHSIHFKAEPAFVYADPNRLEQMVGNLLENALKYTPEGGTINVSVCIEEDEAVVSVSDTGIGIAPELLPRIFDVFVQGEVVNRSKGGLGMGLTVVRSLATQHGATVTAQSPGPGHGSTFTIRFPLVRGESRTAELNQKVSKVGSVKILVIEDNSDLREMVCSMLTMSGHTVLSAADGETGVEMAAKMQPDVALVDIDLPGISGLEVAARLRSNVATRNIKLIAVTGYGQESDRARALNSGFDVHLKKPVEIAELMEAL